MLAPIPVLLFSTAPVIVGGVLNLAFIKSPLFNSLRRPIDGGRLWKDGKPIFGPNKTWKGVIGSVVLTAAAMVLFGAIVSESLTKLTVYRLSDTQPLLFLLFQGALLGLAYVVFELPNSFLKRRLDIAAGRSGGGLNGRIFRTIDQIDSVVGCGLVLLLLGSISAGDVIVLVLFGGLVHIPISKLLHVARLR
jgi:hypothetical protein